jgi:hypothetical protein
MSWFNSFGDTTDLGADRSSPSKGQLGSLTREVRLASHHRPGDQAADAPTPDITRSDPECGDPARLQDTDNSPVR